MTTAEIESLLERVRKADAEPVAVKGLTWVTEPSGLEVATLEHDEFSLVEIVKSRNTRSAFSLTIHRTNEETSRRDDLSIDLTEGEARSLAATLLPALVSTPAPGLVEALRPFAKIADDYDDAEDDEFQVWQDFDVLGARLPLKHFRAARAALSSITETGGAKND